MFIHRRGVYLISPRKRRSYINMNISTAVKTETDRLTKGVSFIYLIKILKIYRRQHPLSGLSRATEALFNEHILPTKWYPHKCFIELLDITYRVILDSDEQNTVQMGINGGQAILKGVHGAFVRNGDPIGSVMALRHIWPTYYDFGGLNAELIESSSVIFTLIGYPDIELPHAMTILGWGIAAAQLGGAVGTNHEVLERPWAGASAFKYRIDVE